jgi:hypothetical protein
LGAIIQGELWMVGCKARLKQTSYRDGRGKQTTNLLKEKPKHIRKEIT